MRHDANREDRDRLAGDLTADEEAMVARSISILRQAFETARQQEIDSDLFATTMLHAATEQLVVDLGRGDVQSLLEDVIDSVENGEFDPA